MVNASLATSAALAAIAVAGCGSVSKTAPTLAQFAARADKICVTLTSEQGPIEARLAVLTRTGAPAQAFAPLWRETASISRMADTQVKLLPRPPAHVQEIGPLVGGYFEEASDEDKLANAYANGDSVSAESTYSTLQSLERRDAAVASSLGMTDCAKAESGDAETRSGI